MFGMGTESGGKEKVGTGVERGSRGEGEEKRHMGSEKKVKSWRWDE